MGMEISDAMTANPCAIDAGKPKKVGQMVEEIST